MIEVLENEATEGEGADKRPKYDLKTKMAIFDKAVDWLKQAPKLRPGGKSSETEGIDLLRSMIADPIETIDRVLGDPACVRELESRNWLPPPPVRVGRPTLAESAHKARAKSRKKGVAELRPDDDDSKLAKLVGN